MDCPVPVVRLILPNADDKVLILKRAHSDYGEGQWCLPGGKVDYGQTVHETVVKELREETALRCTSARFLFYQDSLPPEPGKMHCINLYFECAVTGQIRLDTDESSDHRWVGRGELAQYDIVFRNAEGLKRYWGART